MPEQNNDEATDTESPPQKKRPTLVQSLIPLIAVAFFLGVGYGYQGLAPEIMLIASGGVAGIIAVRLGYTYKELEKGVIASMSKGMPAILIVIVVGALIGSWIISGAIPMMIYYGLQIVSGKYFLVTACIVCSIVSVVTGTSYGTVGTLGVAFMGIAHGLQVPLDQAAGAIVAGSYFGDKISPFSDTTNLAPLAARSNLYDHIRHTLWTTTPAMIFGLIIYLFAGRSFSGPKGAAELATESIMTSIREAYHFHPLLLLPPAITLYAAATKRPIIPGMMISATVAAVMAIWLQGAELKAAVESMVKGVQTHTGNADVDKLLSRGGMLSMMHVTLRALCAFVFGGIAQTAGMLDVLLEKLLAIAHTTGRLIAATVSSSMLVALMTGSSFLSILLPGELFQPAFKKAGLAAKNLSRTTEDSGTVIVPLIPWSIAGVFMAETLGVDTLAYAKWAILCYTSFIVAILYGYTGFAIAPRKREDETMPGS